MYEARTRRYSSSEPSTHEKIMSTAKSMSMAWSANMFSIVGQVRPKRSTVPRTASATGTVRRVSEFSMGSRISSSPNSHSSTCTPVPAP